MTRTLSVDLPSGVIYVSGTVNNIAVTWTNTSGNVWESTVDRSIDNSYAVDITMLDSLGQSTRSVFTIYYGLSGLITDRTYQDVLTAKTLSAKNWVDFTQLEKEMWIAGLKGCYNATDLNRVGSAIVYLTGRFQDLGYEITTNPKLNWSISDIPTLDELNTYLGYVKSLRDCFDINGLPVLPNDMTNFTYNKANNIESLLLSLEFYINSLISSLFYSNEIESGEI